MGSGGLPKRRETVTIVNHEGEGEARMVCIAGACKLWTGLLEWITGLDYWSRIDF